MKKSLTILILLFFVWNIPARGGEKIHEHKKELDHEEEHEHHRESKTGDNKAILEFFVKKGLKFNPKVLSQLNLKFIEPSGNKIPVNTLIYFNEQKGIIRKRGEYFSFVPVEIEKYGNKNLTIKFSGKNDLRVGDKFVQGDLDVIQASLVFAQDKSEYSHSH